MNKRGMTLIEILIVLVILGVIAGFGIPGFLNMMEQTRMNEARVNLGIIHMGQRVFRTNNPTFWNGGTVNITAPPHAVTNNLNVDVRGNFYPSVTFASTDGFVNNYTASAARVGGSVDWTFTINQAGAIACAGTNCPCNPCT